MNKFATLALALVAGATMSAGCSDDNTPDINRYDDPAATQAPAASTMSIFQANPRAFASADALKALADRVPDIAAMGHDVLWVMPVCDPGQDRAFGSPYCIRDFKAVNPAYGTVADMKALVDKAHANGMKVILDWIANHTAWDCNWMTENPQVYARDANGQMFSPMGWNDVVQLDYSNPETTRLMKEAMMFWIGQTGIDGFRCDYAEGVSHDFWQDAIKDFRALNPDVIMLAETSKGSFYNDGFDMIYDWGYAPNASELFKGTMSPSAYFDASAKTMAALPDGKSILRYAFNHDVAAENDIATYYGVKEAVPAAYCLTAMLDGTPMVYSAMVSDKERGKVSFFDYTPLAWSDAKASVYAAINRAYKRTAEVRNGRLATYANDKAALFSRSANGHTMFVAVNVSADNVSVKTPVIYAGSNATELISDTATTLPVVLTLAPYQYVVYYL